MRSVPSNKGRQVAPAHLPLLDPSITDRIPCLRHPGNPAVGQFNCPRNLGEHQPPQYLNNLPYQGRTRQFLNLAREEYPCRTKPTEPAAFAAHADHDLQSPRPVQGGTQRQHRPARSSSAHPLKSHNTARTVAYGQARTLCDLSPIAIRCQVKKLTMYFWLTHRLEA